MASTNSDHIVEFSNGEGAEETDNRRNKWMSLKSFFPQSARILLLLGLVAVAIDPLFFYVPVMLTKKNNSSSTCFGLDKTLIIVAVIMRTFVDILHDCSWWSKSLAVEPEGVHNQKGADKNPSTSVDRVLTVSSRQPNNHQSSSLARRSKDCIPSSLDGRSNSTIRSRLASVSKQSDNGKISTPDGWSIKRARLIAILASIPFLQVAVLAIGLQSHLKTWIKIGVICQLIPRIFRIYPTYVDVTASSKRYAWIGAAFNLLLFVLASHALGGFWYLRSVERKMDCMKRACEDHFPCTIPSLYCDSGNNNVDNGFINDICSVQPASNSTPPFDYGMNADAIKLDLVGPMNFIKKLASCFWWGINHLTSMGQSIELTNYIWDTCFAIFICIAGLILFALLIGNLQMYLQSKLPDKLEKLIQRREDLEKQRRENLEKWGPFTDLPPHLRREVSMCRHSKWQEVIEVNLQSLLNNIPLDLKRKLKPYFYDNLFHKVNAFEELDEKIKKELRDLAKPVVFQAKATIHQEGYPIYEMIHIVHGNLLAYNNKDVKEGLPAKELKKNDSFGEELLLKALKSPLPNLPLATRTIQSVAKVEGFALSFGDFSKTFAKYGLLIEAYKEEWAAHLVTNAVRKKVAIEKRKKSSQEGEWSQYGKKSLRGICIAPEPSSSGL